MTDETQDVRSRFTSAKVGQQLPSQLDIVSSIRRGLLQAEMGIGRAINDVFDELEGENSTP